MNYRNAYLSLIMLIGFTALTGCQSGGHSNESIHAEMSAYTGNLTKEKAKAILDAYLISKDGLVATDANTVKKGAQQLVSVFDSSMEMDKTLKIIKASANKIAGSDDIKKQREQFEGLSVNVLAIIKGGGVNEGDVYLQYCPMASDNNGAYWLSTSSEIRNPYFGDKMLKCGKIVETLN